jgi:membrane protein
VRQPGGGDPDVVATTPQVVLQMAEVLVLIYRGWRDHRVVRLGAGLAYYGLFALVPLVTAMVAVADLLVTFESAVMFVAVPLAELLGEDVDVIAARISEQVTELQQTGTFGVVGLVAVFISASLLFVALQDAFNVIWEVPYQVGLQQTIRRRLLAFGVVLIASAVVIASLAIQAVIGWLGEAVSPSALASLGVADALSRFVPVTVVAVGLALLYGLLAPAGVDPWAAAIGGAVAASLLAAGVVVLGWLLQRTATFSATGAASSLFVVLTAFYVESQIVLVGGEFTRVVSERRRSAPGNARRRPHPLPG